MYSSISISDYFINCQIYYNFWINEKYLKFSIIIFFLVLEHSSSQHDMPSVPEESLESTGYANRRLPPNESNYQNQNPKKVDKVPTGSTTGSHFADETSTLVHGQQDKEVQSDTRNE